MNQKRLFYSVFGLFIFLVLLSFVSAEGIICSSNSDCFNGFVGTEYCMSNDVYKVFQNSNCVNPGTTDSYCNNVGTPTLLIDCGVDSWNSWSDNYCKDNNVYHSRNGMKRGCEVINTNSNISGCYFEFASEEALVQTCTDECSNGVCNNPPVINCSSNAECGTNGFVDGLFCQNNDVFQNFITHTCINPGNSNSYCTSSINAQMKQDCDDIMQTCSNGMCMNKNIPCSNNLECDDSNTHTQDICNNPCLPSSYCTHTNILCLNNLECGANGFVDGLFCQNNNVFQNFITYTCINPGQTNSYCTNSTNSQLKEDCNNVFRICSNGICINPPVIICNNNSECNDNNDYTYDICNNPGTPESSCSHNPIICFKDSDCGNNGYVNERYCQDNNVFQDYKEFECNNPGTVSSSCTNSITSKLTDECSYDCHDGECIDNGNHNMYENPSFKFNYSEKPYVYSSSINFSAFTINESVQNIGGNAVKVENEISWSKIFGNNLLLILIILIIILIILIIIFTLMR